MKNGGITLPFGLIEALRTAQAVTVLTGAGVSAESGLPTFREAQTGLWARYRPEDLATPEAFQHDPRLVWEWYAWRREQAAAALPNPAHLALAEMARIVPQMTLITQNVDSLHQRAGSQDVLELHGNLERARCLREKKIVQLRDRSEKLPPICPYCGGLLRPDIVWFGEQLPAPALSAAIAAATDCNLFLSIGTSGVVEPAASLRYIAAQSGATGAIINLDMTPRMTDMFFQITGRAGEILPALLVAAFRYPEER